MIMKNMEESNGNILWGTILEFVCRDEVKAT
jgi:hypothetical protein